MARVFLSDSLVTPDYKPIKRGPFVDSNGDLWLVYMQSTTSIIVRKSSDKGATWPTDGTHFWGDYISAGVSSYIFDVEFDATNGIFYILLATPYPAHVAYVRKFTISTTTFAAFSTGTGPSILGNTSYVQGHYAANLMRLSTGAFVVAHQGQNGSMTIYDAVYYTPITSAGAWGSRTLVSPSASAHYAMLAATKGSSDRIHIAYWAYNISGGTGAAYHRSLSGSTLDTAAQIGTLTVNDYANHGQFGFDSGSGLLWFSSANVMYRCTSGANPTWTAMSTSPSFSVSPDVPGQICNEPIVYDTLNSVMRILWQGNSNSGYIYENHTTGTTWPNSQSVINNENTWVSQMSYNFVHDNNNTFGLGLFINDNGGPYYLFYALQAISYTETATVPSVTSVSSSETYTPAGGTIYTESATISSKTTPSATEVYTPLPPLPLPYVGYVEASTYYERSDISYNMGPHEDSNGNWWFVNVQDGVSGYALKAYKSSDKGSTWDSGHATADMDINTNGVVTCCFDKANGKLYVASAKTWTGTSPYYGEIQIQVFNVNTQTWSTFSSGTAPIQVYYGGQYPPMILVQLSDGTLVLVYSGPENVGSMSEIGTSCYVVKLSSGGVWGTPIQVDPATATVDYRPQDAVVGASDRVHIIYTGDTNPGAPGTYMYAYHRSLSGTTLDTAQTISGPFAANNGLGPGFTLGYVGGTHTEVLLCMSNSLMRATSGANPTFTEDSVAFSGVSGGQVLPASARVCYWYDSTADKLHVAYYGDAGVGSYGLGTRYLFWRAVYDYGTGIWNNGNGTPTLMFPAYAEAYDGGSSGYPIYGSGGSNEAVAQSFSLPESRTIKGLSIYSTHTGGPPDPYDGIYMELRAGTPDGTLLKSTSARYTAYAFGTTFFFPFDSPYTLAANTTYCLTVKRGWSYYTGSYHVIPKTSADAYRYGSAWVSNSGVWTAQPNDLIFGIPANPMIKGWQWIRPTIDGFGFVWTDYSDQIFTTEFRFAAATFIDVTEVASTTSVSAVERGPFTDAETPASVTAITSDDIYGRSEVATVASVTSVQSDDVYHLGTTVDSATIASTTSLTATEQYGTAVAYTDAATVVSTTQPSADELQTYVYSDATTVDSRTIVSTNEIYTQPQIYTDSATITSVTSISATEIYTPPLITKASFTYEQLGGGTIQFYDTSTPVGIITSWYWDFGDGTTSTEQNPIHTYSGTGTYTVTLTVNGGQTSEATITKTVRAHVSHTAQGTILDGQVAIGTDGSFHWTIGGKWYTAAWAPSIVNAVPQDCVLGQVAIGLDDSFHWYDGTEWHSFATQET